MAEAYPPGAAHPSMATNDSPKVDERVDYSNLPCPIPYEELHHEALRSLNPDLFEGMRFNFVKSVSPKFLLILSASMRAATEMPTQSPETFKIPTTQYEFATSFEDPKLFLFGRLMADGRLNTQGKFDLRENITLNGNGQFSSVPGMSHGIGSLDYKSATPNLSLGGEAFWFGEHRKSCVEFGGRYCTDKMVATAKVASTGMVMLSYVQKISEMISLATNFTYNYVTRESAASVGYDYIFNQSRLRGKIDSNGRVSVFMEERLAGGLRFILSGEIDHQKKDHKCGVGLTFEV